MPVTSFVATGTVCGRHSVAAGRVREFPSPGPHPPPTRLFKGNTGHAARTFQRLCVIFILIYLKYTENEHQQTLHIAFQTIRSVVSRKKRVFPLASDRTGCPSFFLQIRPASGFVTQTAPYQCPEALHEAVQALFSAHSEEWPEQQDKNQKRPRGLIRAALPLRARR